MIVEQILLRVKAAGYVRYIDGKLYVGDDEITIVGTGGGSGDTTQAIIDAAGSKSVPVDADSILIADSASSGVLKKLGVASLSAFIVTYLKSLDFVRVNADKDLLSGSDAIVTQAATGIRFTFSIDNTLSETAAGEVKMNDATPVFNDTVIVTIDYLDKNGTDQSTFMSAWQASGTLSLRSSSTTDTSFAVLSITTVADQNPATNFRVTCKYIGGNAFLGGESCVIEYVPPTSVADAINAASAKSSPVAADKLALIDSAAGNVLKYFTWGNLRAAIDAYMKSLGYARIDSNGNMLDGSNNIVDGINPVYALASAPVSGITELPAANTMTNGAVIAIHKDCLVGAGANPLGVLLRADELNNLFRPACDRAILFAKAFGSLASPTLTMTDTTQATSSIFNVGVNPVIPAGLLYAGCKLRISAQFRRNVAVVGLGAIEVKGYIGTDPTNVTTNSQFFLATISDVDNRDIFIGPVITVLTGTTARSTKHVSQGETGTTSAFNDMTAKFAIASNMYITFYMTTTLNANNSVDLLNFEVELISL